MDQIDPALKDDLAKVASIDAVPMILDICCKTTGMGFAAVARVTDRHWMACAVRDEIGFGLKPGGELELRTTICDEIRSGGQGVVIDNVAEDPLYRDHHTPKIYGLQSYISIPIIRANGEFFGTLCAIDPQPARLNRPEIVGMFKLFADLIAFHLDSQDRLAASQAALLGERHSAELREQFIAVLGHDLRNPIASIESGARLLERAPIDDRSKAILGLMHKSVTRMAGLIDDILDFARGRLGGGVIVDKRVDARLEETLRHVIAEMGASSPGRTIVSEIALDQPVAADTTRMGQLLSNLLGNALTHGAADRPVVVRIAAAADMFELSVSNAGQPIPAEDMERLFQPFTRTHARSGSREGLGLGLYIASEIARAHGGRLEAVSTPQQTCFTFRMPLG